LRRVRHGIGRWLAGLLAALMLLAVPASGFGHQAMARPAPAAVQAGLVDHGAHAGGHDHAAPEPGAGGAGMACCVAAQCLPATLPEPGAPPPLLRIIAAPRPEPPAGLGRGIDRAPTAPPPRGTG